MSEFGWLQRVSERIRGDNRRRRGRIRSRDASTPLGDIVNISGGGMRLRTKKRKLAAEGLSYTVPLKLSFGERLALRGETVWATRLDSKLYEIGIRWADPDREASTISRLVEITSSSHNTTMFESAPEDAA